MRVSPGNAERYAASMNIFLILIIIVAIALLLVGGLVEAVRFLLWVGLILAIIAVIMWLLRAIGGRKR